MTQNERTNLKSQSYTSILERSLEDSMRDRHNSYEREGDYRRNGGGSRHHPYRGDRRNDRELTEEFRSQGEKFKSRSSYGRDDRSPSPERSRRTRLYAGVEYDERTKEIEKTEMFEKLGDSFVSREKLIGHEQERGSRKRDAGDRSPTKLVQYETPKKIVMDYSKTELAARSGHYGSTLSILDRRKFEKEFDVSSLKLSREHRYIYEDNPHIRQVFANERQFIRDGKTLCAEDRYETTASGHTRYSRRQGEAKTVDHWGQRKLLFSEIEFLTLYGDKGCTIVYAGAAPGTHIKYLSEELFPDVNFVLVDPAPFDVKETDKIKIINDFYTDELAMKYSKKNGYDKLLFVSDIRSMSASMSDRDKEERVKIDMKCQAEWHKIMEPTATMLKLRMPYVAGTTTYLSGKVFFPIWGGRTTTETRLVVTSNEERVYDHNEYEDLMFHHNTITRTSYFEHDVKGEGLDHCFDCSSEIFVLGQYIRKHMAETVKEDAVNGEIAWMSKHISRVISNNGRTLRL